MYLTFSLTLWFVPCRDSHSSGAETHLHTLRSKHAHWTCFSCFPVHTHIITLMLPDTSKAPWNYNNGFNTKHVRASLKTTLTKDVLQQFCAETLGQAVIQNQLISTHQNQKRKPLSEAGSRFPGCRGLDRTLLRVSLWCPSSSSFQSTDLSSLCRF